MTKRKPLSKRIRFEVFKRDSFTCQYCGAQPPGVVLECDHIKPVANGGGNSMENLITSCEECNRGKSDKLLGDRAVRPDATLMYLQTQQEIAELKRYQKEKQIEREAFKEFTNILDEACWDASDSEWAPLESTILKLIERFPLKIVFEACIVTAQAIERGRIYAEEYESEPYLWGVCKRMYARQQKSGGADQ